jgi:hypothetical protein
MFGSHRARNLAGFGQFADGVLVLQQHLHYPQAMRVRQRAQTLRRIVQSIQIGQSQS